VKQKPRDFNQLCTDAVEAIEWLSTCWVSLSFERNTHDFKDAFSKYKMCIEDLTADGKATLAGLADLPCDPFVDDEYCNDEDL